MRYLNKTALVYPEVIYMITINIAIAVLAVIAGMSYIERTFNALDTKQISGYVTIEELNSISLKRSNL